MIKTKGFTLIEILIVVGMVSILASTLAVSLKPQMFFNMGNDAKRKNDLKQLQNALASYYSDKKEYPCFAANCNVDVISNIVGLTPSYIESIPTDPKSGTNCPAYMYVAYSTKDAYTIYTKLEDSADPEATKIKPPPKVITCQTTDSWKTCTMEANRSCGGTLYNYWVSNP